MTEPQLPPIQPYFPTTFLERGVTVPFTTPLLFGARARPALRNGIELILPNPTGGRGVYVLAWESVREFCRPTVHDRQLILRITALPAITPGAIRRVSQQVAAEGMAGEAAMEAALATIDVGKAELIAANFSLLMTLIEQVDVATPAEPAAQSLPDLELRAQRSVARIAPRIGQPPAWVSRNLEDLAQVFCDIGLQSRSRPSRVCRMLDLLRRVRGEIGTWSRQHSHDPLVCYAEMICEVADLTLSLATATFEQAHALTHDPVELLQAWAADPGSVIRTAGRPEWLLDGWDQISNLWRQAKHPVAQRAALAEIAQLVPVLPREAIEWAGIMLDGERLTLLRRYVPLNEDWRTGATVFELLARNECLRAAEV